MNFLPLSLGCASCHLNRRSFIRSCAACIGSASFLAPQWLAAGQAKRKTRVRLVFALHAAQQPGPDWPNKGFDFVPVMDRFTTELTERCKGFEFLTSTA